MAIGERIRYIRNLRGMTQKWLGMKLGFTEKTADVRMAQYENGARTPKEQMISDIAQIFDVSPQALKVPDTDSYLGLAHTLFALEDIYGLKIDNVDGQLCLTLHKSKSNAYHNLFELFSTWHNESEKFKKGEITEDEYNSWRYTFPKMEAERTKASIDALRKQENESDS